MTKNIRVYRISSRPIFQLQHAYITAFCCQILHASQVWSNQWLRGILTKNHSSFHGCLCVDAMALQTLIDQKVETCQTVHNLATGCCIFVAIVKLKSLQLCYATKNHYNIIMFIFSSLFITLLVLVTLFHCKSTKAHFLALSKPHCHEFLWGFKSQLLILGKS